MRYFFIITFLLTLCTFVDLVSAKELVVGMELSYPPFEMTTKEGKPSGISVEIAEALGKYLKRPVRIENIGYDGLIPALKTGKIDCVISSMTATEERSRSVDFSDSYLKTGLSLLVASSSKIQSASDLDLDSHKIAVKKGTTGHQYASKNLRKAKVLLFDKESAAVLEVSQGKADAFIYDALSVFHNHQRHLQTTRALLKPFQEESWAIALRKGNSDLLIQVNKFLKSYKEEGGFDKLGDKYLSEEKKAFMKMNVPFLF
jgi:polar amino acid transport system substrate-binding protein